MDKNAVVHKTAKGEGELKTRAAGLPQNLRIVLILVDDTSTVGQLLEKGKGLPDVEGALSALRDGGFVSITDSAQIDYVDVKERLIAVAKRVLGKEADKVVAKLRNAPDSRDGLLAATDSCKKMVTLFIDEDKAEELIRECQKVLSAV